MAGIRVLKAEEIECRVGTINEKGLSLLLFKDARVDQKLLDETFTPMGWRRSHCEIGGNLYCTVSVWDDEKRQWIDKQDVGVMGREEKEKSQASDSFKRACFNWGIGRELYTAPFIWIGAERVPISAKQAGNGGTKYYTNERFRVASIDYTEEREIRALSIEDSKSHIVYMYSTQKSGGLPKAQERQQEKAEGIQGRQREEAAGIQERQRKETAGAQERRQERAGLGTRQINALQREMERTGVALQTVLGRYQIQDVGQMTPQMYKDAITGLKRSKDAGAA